MREQDEMVLTITKTKTDELRQFLINRLYTTKGIMNAMSLVFRLGNTLKRIDEEQDSKDIQLLTNLYNRLVDISNETKFLDEM